MSFTKETNQELDPSLHIMKFGGTSVGGARPIERVAGIIENYSITGLKLVTVVSAIRGVTNNLVRVCELIAENKDPDLILEDILVKHLDVITDLGLAESPQRTLEDNLEQLFFELHAETRRPGRMSSERSDKILSFGERINARIVTAKLLARGIIAEPVDASEIIETDNHFGEATPDLKKTAGYARNRLEPLLNGGVVPVVTGFIGATKDGKITTLGRGGSDYTASILGRVLNAGAVWIWTDVNGVYTSDPRHNPDAQLLSELSQFHANQMVQTGIQVLYPKTLLPLLDTDIELRIKNTFDPDADGTTVKNRLG